MTTFKKAAASIAAIIAVAGLGAALYSCDGTEDPTDTKTSVESLDRKTVPPDPKRYYVIGPPNERGFTKTYFFEGYARYDEWRNIKESWDAYKKTGKAYRGHFHEEVFIRPYRCNELQAGLRQAGISFEHDTKFTFPVPIVFHYVIVDLTTVTSVGSY
jgi:hypothetical protein